MFKSYNTGLSVGLYICSRSSARCVPCSQNNTEIIHWCRYCYRADFPSDLSCCQHMSRCHVRTRKMMVQVRLRKMHRRLEKERLQQGTSTITNIQIQPVATKRQLTKEEEEELDQEIAHVYFMMCGCEWRRT